MSILTGLLPLISLIYPPAAPVIGILTTLAPYAIAAEPLIVAAFKEGPGAFKAAEQAAPELAAQIKALSNMLPDEVKSAFTHTGSGDALLENVTRAIFTLPHMTHEQEMTWMNNATPHNDPSQENSTWAGG